MANQLRQMCNQAEKPAAYDFAHAVVDLSSLDSDIFNAAFEFLIPIADRCKTQIFMAMNIENNLRAKAAMIELLGISKDPKFIPHLAVLLDSEHPEIRFWSHVALTKIGTIDSLRIANSKNLRQLVGDCITKD